MVRKGSSRLRPLLIGVIAVTAACGSLAVAGSSHARADAFTTACTPDPALDSVDPCQYDYSKAIIDHIQVPVPPTAVDAINTQSAPAVDYIWVDYIHPAVPAGVKVPTIMDASPYYNMLGRGYAGILKTPYDPNAPQPPGVERCGGATTCTNYQQFPEWEAHYFVPRGYAVALMDLRGTRNSSGCEVYGDQQEALDAVNVVDWIASQSWSNGKVGMIGGSYDGTIANGAAALYPKYGNHHYADGTDALAAVVPIRAIDRWYDYSFINGVDLYSQNPVDPELFTSDFPAEDWPNSGPTASGGDPQYAANLAQRKACPAIEQIPTDAGYASMYQDTKDSSTANFWNNRDYLQYTPTWKAATLFIHGLFDNNVKTLNSGQLWQALQSRTNPPPSRYLWFNGGHADPDTPSYQIEMANPSDAGEYFMPFTWMQKFEHEVHQWFLQYLKGVDAGVAQEPKVEIQRGYDDPGDTLQQGHWDAYSQFPVPGSDAILHFNAAKNTATAAAALAGSVQWDDEASGSAAPLNQSFLTDAFATDTHISGQFQFDVNIAAAGPDTTIAVEVDDVPPGAENDTTFATDQLTSNKDPFAFTYGYIRAYYRDSVKPRGASYPTGGSPLTPNTQYAISFPSTYTDYILPAGHKLRFTFSDASPYTLATDQGNVVTMYSGLNDGTSQVRIPVASTGPAPNTPDLTGIAGVGGPATGAMIVGAMLTIGAVRRRRTRR